MKFGTSSYPIQKYAIKTYLQQDLATMVVDYMFDNYELPKVSGSERAAIFDAMVKSCPDMTKEIFAHAGVAKRFIRELENNVAYNDEDSFAYTCRTASENCLFFYQPNPRTKEAQEQNRRMKRIFNPVLDNLANDMALNVDGILQTLRVDRNREDVIQAQKIIEDNGGRVIWEARARKGMRR